MIKKIGLSLLLLFAILFIWTTYANPIIADPVFWRHDSNICYKIGKVKIDNYKVIIESNRVTNEWNVYELKSNECVRCSKWKFSRVYLVDKNVNVKDITEKNIADIATYVWDIRDSDCVSFYDKKKTYNITKNEDSYELMLTKTVSFGKIKEFPFIWLWTIIIETLLLFFMAKIFRKESQISNKKLILFWILTTTITLPLLWFFLPLLIWDWIRYTIIWETLVTAIEAIIIKYWLNISRKRSIIASIICNLFSFLLLSFKNWEGIWNLYIRLFLLWFLIQPIILLIMGKWLRKRDEIPNKRFIITWIVAPIVAILLIILLWFTFSMYVENRLILLILWMLIFTLTFVIEIKFWIEVSWKKAILMAVVSDLSLLVLLLIFYLVIYWFYE